MPPLTTMERFKPSRLSIKWKVFVPVGGILLAAFLVYASIGLHSAESQLLEKTGRSETVLATMVERVIRPAVVRGDTATLERLLSDLEGLPDLKALRVARLDGHLLSGQESGRTNAAGQTNRLRERALLSPNESAGELGEDWIYHVVRVIRRSDEYRESSPVGFLEMDLSVADTQHTIESGRMEIAFVSLAALLVLAAALMIVINVLVSDPLARLTEAMRRVEEGDLTARASIASGDELEQLGHSFNRMVEEIALKNEQLVEAGQQLLKSEKLASIGLLAAGVAHEINNPVATISMSAEGLLETDPSPERRRFLKVIVEESERIGSIVRNLIGFEKGGHTAYRPCSLVRILEEAVQDLRHEAERAGVTMTLNLDLPHDTLLGQADQLREAFVNIMDNALRAMSPGGRLEVTGEWVDETARIHFLDTGPGISEEDQKRIFDPFFTTREVGEGFGLGLTVCYEIVKRHNGDIAVRSGPDGTTFTLKLPLLKENESG